MNWLGATPSCAVWHWPQFKSGLVHPVSLRCLLRWLRCIGRCGAVQTGAGQTGSGQTGSVDTSKDPCAGVGAGACTCTCACLVLCLFCPAPALPSPVPAQASTGQAREERPFAFYRHCCFLQSLSMFTPFASFTPLPVCMSVGLSLDRPQTLSDLSDLSDIPLHVQSGPSLVPLTRPDLAPKSRQPTCTASPALYLHPSPSLSCIAHRSLFPLFLILLHQPARILR